MNTPYSSPVLDAFHARGLVTTEGLFRWLRRARPTELGGRAWIEQGHARWLDAIRDSIPALARELGRSPLEALRHALTTTDQQHLPVWQHAAESDVFSGVAPRETVLDFLERVSDRTLRTSSSVRIQLTSLSRATQCPAAALVKAVQSSWQVWLCLLQDDPDRQTNHQLVQFLKVHGALRTPTPAYGKKRLRIISRHVMDLCAKRPGICLSKKQLESLPASFLETLDDITCIADAAAKDAIKAQCRKAERTIKNAERQRDRLRSSRSAVVERSTTDALEATRDLIAKRGSTSAVPWRRIVAALKQLQAAGDDKALAALSSQVALLMDDPNVDWSAIASAPSAARKTLHSELAEVAPESVQFLALPRSQQYLVAPHSALSTTLRKRRHRLDTLAGDLLKIAVRRYLAAPSKSARVWDGAGFGSWIGRHDAWDRAFLKRRVLHPAEHDALMEWLNGTSPEARRSFATTHRKWMAQRMSDERFVTMVINELSPLAAHDLFASNLTWMVAAFGSLERVEPAHRRRTKLAFNQLLVAGPPRSKSLAGLVASQGPRILGIDTTLNLLGTTITAERLAAMFSCAGELNRPGRAAGALFTRASSRNRSVVRRAMCALLREPEALDASVANGLWRGALHAGTSEALDLASRRPEDFMGLAVRDLNHGVILERAACQPNFSRCLHPFMTVDALHAALPEARRRLRNRPLMRAVLELSVASDLREMAHLREIARSILRQPKKIAPGHALNGRYRNYEIPKRSGGKRAIAAPDDHLKRLQRRLLNGLLDGVPLHEAAHGFRRGRSILTNATAHAKQNMVVNVDIKGFFPNTSYPRVLAACLKVDRQRLSVRGAKLLAEICCAHGALPTGAPTSPVLGNIVLRRADAAISAAAARHGVTYTRYADDLTFSGNTECKRIIPFVKRVLGELGYEIDAGKTQVYRKGRQQLVTNLVVNERANLRRSERRRLRAAVHRRCTGSAVLWHGAPMDDAQLRGRIALLHMVEPSTAKEYQARLSQRAPGWTQRHD